MIVIKDNFMYMMKHISRQYSWSASYHQSGVQSLVYRYRNKA